MKRVDSGPVAPKASSEPLHNAQHDKLWRACTRSDCRTYCRREVVVVARRLCAGPEPAAGRSRCSFTKVAQAQKTRRSSEQFSDPERRRSTKGIQGCLCHKPHTIQEGQYFQRDVILTTTLSSCRGGIQEENGTGTAPKEMDTLLEKKLRSGQKTWCAGTVDQYEGHVCLLPN
jgi:hypothetical protein